MKVAFEAIQIKFVRTFATISNYIMQKVIYILLFRDIKAIHFSILHTNLVKANISYL